MDCHRYAHDLPHRSFAGCAFQLQTRFYVLSNGTVLMVGCVSTQNPIATEIMFFNADRILNAIETYLVFKLEDDQNN